MLGFLNYTHTEPIDFEAHPELEAGILDRRPDPLATFADRGVGQVDNMKLGQCGAHVHLDGHRAGLDATRSRRGYPCQHTLQ